ncbi:glycosyltransferase family 4 protein [Hansschlegelia plantiphila]|uniref:Glycosyl transferase n=1 Tax=Hansschlegelia plantiphila TaxID=374655 RepID=A0A9W6J5G4_9HYPH|nr:glycosyltransferase family 4 protein [Hansschlegelia plantiphila]GLK69724.1 glycosyl transferase [Hansschlegelia plantiphila]
MPKILLSANAAWNLANFRGGLIRGLLSAGHELVAAAPWDEHARRLEVLGCRFVSLPMDNKGTSPAADARLFQRYRRLIKSQKPDIYLGFTIKPNVYGTLAARSLGVPVINNISGLGTAFIRDSWLTRAVQALYRIALTRSSIVFFQNSEDLELFARLRLVQRERVAILPGSGVDLAHHTPAPMADRGGAARFLLIARLLRDKGVGEYVEAAAAVRRDFPNARFQILGFLDVDNRTAVTRAEMSAWVAAGLVDYLGATDDVRPFIAEADCVVLPSYREGTPRTLLEGAAAARPLIATNVPGCREPVRDGHNGFLCAVRDGSSLANAMRRFLEASYDARVEMGRRSRAIAEDRYDERFVIDAYLNAIDVALSAPRKAVRR